MFEWKIAALENKCVIVLEVNKICHCHISFTSYSFFSYLFIHLFHLLHLY